MSKEAMERQGLTWKSPIVIAASAHRELAWIGLKRYKTYQIFGMKIV